MSFGPFQEGALTKLIFFGVGIADEGGKGHRSELPAILAFKHIALELDFSLLRFVFGTRFGDRTPILVIPKVIPPDFAPFSNCQRTSPPLGVAATAEVSFAW